MFNLAIFLTIIFLVVGALYFRPIIRRAYRFHFWKIIGGAYGVSALFWIVRIPINSKIIRILSIPVASALYAAIFFSILDIESTHFYFLIIPFVISNLTTSSLLRNIGELQLGPKQDEESLKNWNEKWQEGIYAITSFLLCIAILIFIGMLLKNLRLYYPLKMILVYFGSQVSLILFPLLTCIVECSWKSSEAVFWRKKSMRKNTNASYVVGMMFGMTLNLTVSIFVGIYNLLVGFFKLFKKCSKCCTGISNLFKDV